MSARAGQPAVGSVLGPRSFHITRDDLRRYAEASGDHNPIHQDEEVALAVGLPGVIAHGMYTLALAARSVREWLPGAEVLEIGAKFTRPVVVPAEGAAEVEVAATVEDLQGDEVRLSLEVTCEGEKVLGTPRALLRVPEAGSA